MMRSSAAVIVGWGENMVVCVEKEGDREGKEKRERGELSGVSFFFFESFRPRKEN